MKDIKNIHTLSSANISELAFWDVEPGLVDIEDDSLYVIGQVFNFGTWKDIQSVIKYYGISRIRKEIIFAPWLKNTAISFLCLITGLKKHDFVSIMKRQHHRNSVWKE